MFALSHLLTLVNAILKSTNSRITHYKIPTKFQIFTTGMRIKKSTLGLKL
jgi:hypothetical protein